MLCRRLSTTHSKTAVKGNLALGLGGEVQGVIHIELILKDQRKRGNFIGQEERDSGYSRLVFSLCRVCLPIFHVVVRPLSEDTVLFQGMRIVSLHR